MARQSSHDFDGHRRYAALYRTRIGNWNFLRLHAVVSAQDVIIDCSGMGLPMQQDRRRDRGYPARRADLGDACNLPRRVSIRVLEFALASRPACALSAVWTTRLHALACVFTRRMADVLARVCWLPVSGGSFSNRHLFCNAVTGEPGPDATEDEVIELASVTASSPMLQLGEGDLRTVCQSECRD